MKSTRKPELPEFSSTQITQIREMSVRGISTVLEFCLPRKNTPQGNVLRPFDSTTLKIAMRRFVSVAWLLHSNMLRGENDEALTLEQLSKLPQLDCTKVALSLQAKRFGDQFNFHARVQKRVGTKPNYASAAKTGWAKRRAREAAAATA
jgi:hypothetical protein